MSTKDPRTLKDSDLLDIIEDKDNAEEPEVLPENTVIQFLADFGIYPGTNRVSVTLLYNLYRNAFPDNYEHSREFHLLLKGYLEHSIDERGILRYYSLNIEAKNLTRQLASFLNKKKTSKLSRIPAYQKHVNKFCRALKVKPGQGRIPAMALYFFYDKWDYARDKKDRKCIKYKTFIQIIKSTFKTVKTRHHTCVIKLDREFFKQFTEEEIQTALDWAQKYNEKEYGKKKKPPEGEKQTF